jgi:hypothetical protein
MRRRKIFSAVSTLFLAAVQFAAIPASLFSSAPGAAPPQRRKPAAKVEPVPDLPFEALLDRATEYCRRLENSAFDFVCREEIKESIDPAFDVNISRKPELDLSKLPPATATPYSGPTVVIRTYNIKKIKHSYVYDYQCVRAGRTIREVRTLLKEDGKKKVVPNADLATSIVVFSNALMAPVNLFSERFRPSYDFSVVGEDKIGKVRVLVVDAKPRPGAPPTRNLYGKAWLDPKTGDILRIEWSENRVGHYDIFEKRGAMFKRTPRLVIRSEFSAEKNGIRFPSSLYVEEAYLTDKGKVFVRSKTEVVYTDFKFFSVTYDVR